jgi:hypothetical protein
MQQKEFYHATGQGSAAIGTSQPAPVDGHSIANVDGHASRKSAVHTPAQKLETARQRVRAALRLAADETPSYAVLDDIARGLSLATRDLEEAAMAVAVLQRREAQS